MRQLSFFILITCLTSSLSLYPQGKSGRSEFGKLPGVTHFSRSDFKADAQFWAMTRDKEGILYFGNNDGVIIYNGERWQKVVLPNNSSVRSLTTTKEGKIYAGGFNELGLIEKDSVGRYFYRSLIKDLKLENEKLENLWQVHQFKDQIIYRAFNELIAISGNAATHIPSNHVFIYSGIVNDRYYLQDSGYGLLEFDPETMKLNPIFRPEDIDHNEIKGFLPTQNKEELLIVTKNGNLYLANIGLKTIRLWKTLFSVDNSDQVISSLKHSGNYLIGTLSSNIIVITESGEIIRESPAFSNVSNSSVLNLYSSGENVWALLNNGLAFIEFDSPVSRLFDEASIYDILVDKDFIYLATNKGVYYSGLHAENDYNHSLNFKKIPNLEGQTWSIQKEQGSIIIGHDKGLFLLENGLPQQIGNVDGFWKIMPVKDIPGTYLAANYKGLYLLKKCESGWSLQHKINGFDESSRDLLKSDEKNTYWVCHGYKGVYKLKINDDYSRVYALDHYTDQNGLTSPFNVNVTRWKDDIIFTSNTGIYRFDYKKNNFEAYAPLNKILDTTFNTRKIIKTNDTAWIVQDDAVGYFDSREINPRIHKELFLNLKGNLNRGMESILPLGDGKVLIGATTGLYLYNTNLPKFSREASTRITKVSYMQGENEESIPFSSKNKIQLPTKTDIMRFEFAAPEMSPSSLVQYQYILEGIEKKWSSWDSPAFKEYTHLRPGDYTFKVRSRNLNGNAGKLTSFSFGIPPVWYQTIAAFISYTLIFIAAIVLLVFLIRKKIENEKNKAKLAAQKSKKLLELEIEQLKLKRDKESINRDKQVLEEDNIRKSKELANYTMMLVKKKDIFSDTYNNLKEFKKTLNTQTARKRLQDILFKLHQHRIGEEYMDIFDVNFERVHKNFFRQLMIINPELTQRELRLCAFVKMNLTNKEIAPLLNISVRGVETARYRTRKKLNVQEVNFISFLQKLTENPDFSEVSVITPGTS